jgi:hypothetical protein
MFSSQHRGLARVTLLSVALLTLTAGAVRAQDPLPNIGVMRQITADTMGELLGQMSPFIQGRPVYLAPYANDERYEFLNLEISKLLSANGYRAIANPTGMVDTSGVSGEGTGLRLEYQALDFSIRYPKIYRSYLIGGKQVKRSARISLSMKLVDPYDQSVVWVGEAAQGYEDQFAHKHLPQVEAGLFEFTKPEQESRKWGKVVEPVVVSGIVVGLIYLFFSNQDNQ